jgi:two-component system LytT family response regulator
MGGMKLRAVIVEDEELSLSRLKRLLDGFSEQVEVVGEAGDGPSAVDIVRKTTPDLLFLDIDLPGYNAFEVLERLDRQPAVVFTTGSAKHALDAFKTLAVDYLVKPIEAEDLVRALEKLQRFNHAQFSRALEQLLDLSGSRYLVRIPCKVGDRTIIVKAGEVLYLQADNKYTAVHTATNEYLIDTPLTELEQRLNPRDFTRIHRGTIVNIAWIAEIRRTYDGKLSVVLKNSKGTELVASRTYAENLKNL